jgi:NAD(P)-dependent dehydrogenase (short-subunit alcohol dehydrogenase family)
MGRLRGKVVVVTGAAGLLGVQHTLAVLEEGGSVAMLDIDQNGLDRFKNSLSSEMASRVLANVCDIRDEDQIEQIANEIISKFGAITGLVNNAAINPSVEKNTNRFERFETFSRQTWLEEIDVGLWGSVVCSRVFGKYMISSGVSGSIVNVSSDHGIIAPMQHLYNVEDKPNNEQPVKPVTYSVIKHGLIGLTRYLATYWASSDIRVNALCPGGVFNGQNAVFSEKFKKVVPLARFSKPDEYKGAIIYLLSDESSYMTGSVMVVDGGRSVW